MEAANPTKMHEHRPTIAPPLRSRLSACPLTRALRATCLPLNLLINQLEKLREQICLTVYSCIDTWGIQPVRCAGAAVAAFVFESLR